MRCSINSKKNSKKNIKKNIKKNHRSWILNNKNIKNIKPYFKTHVENFILKESVYTNNVEILKLILKYIDLCYHLELFLNEINIHYPQYHILNPKDFSYIFLCMFCNILSI